VTFLQRYLMVGIVVFFGAAESRADFVGQTVEFQYSGCEMFSTVVPSTGYSYPQPGWYCNPYLGVELTGSNLTLSEVPPASETIYGGSLTSPTLITLSDLTYSDQVITSVSVDPSTDVVGFDASRVSFDNEDVYINVGGLSIYDTSYFNGSQYVLISSQVISLDFTFSGNPAPIVPEPRMIWLLVTATLILGSQRQSRLRRKRTLVGNYVKSLGDNYPDSSNDPGYT
jgi:hypothetical protein